MNSSSSSQSSLLQTLTQRLVFVCGKGGVGKTTLSRSIAHASAQKGARTLWVGFDDPLRPEGEIHSVRERLWELNCTLMSSFEEFIVLKMGSPRLAKLITHNKIMRYLAKASPGIPELILLGKVHHECKNFDRVVVDLPATGHGVAMFQSTLNFSRLFSGGPIQKDAIEMLQDFGDPQFSGFVLVALPEEMPLQEAIELDGLFHSLFPSSLRSLIVNRCLQGPLPQHVDFNSPIPSSIVDFLQKRIYLQNENLQLLRNLPYDQVPAFVQGNDFEGALTEFFVHKLEAQA